MTEQDAIKAAKTLKKWCNERECEKCILFNSYVDRCEISRHSPNVWIIPKRWTNDDIQLAKVLSKVGIISISYDAATGAWWCTKDTTGSLPKGSFPSLKDGEMIPIAEIIGDSE